MGTFGRLGWLEGESAGSVGALGLGCDDCAENYDRIRRGNICSLLRQVYIHFHQRSNDGGFGAGCGEAVEFEDGPVEALMGAEKLVWHCPRVVKSRKAPVGKLRAGV